MADVDGGHQMADVGRIERAPEYPDVLGFFGAAGMAGQSTGDLLPFKPARATGPVLTCLLQ